MSLNMPAILRARQFTAVATAFTLPLSTSGQAIAVSIFAVLTILSLDRVLLNDVIRRPAVWLPVLLVALIFIGVLWSKLPLDQAIKWVGPYAKLLLIPLAMAATFSQRQLIEISLGFLAACLILLTLSWTSFLWPSGPWTWFASPGVPVKDNAVQSECFALCAFGLALMAIRFGKTAQPKLMLGCAVLGLLFFADLFLIFLSKTGVLVAMSLLGVLATQLGNWRRAAMLAATAVLIGIAVSLVSMSAQRRITEITSDLRANDITQESVSTASRRDFWQKAYVFVKQSPVFGHGTGSIRPLYQEMEASAPSPYGQAVADPHNQILHTVLQVGLVGGLILIAMWTAHFRLFWARDTASLIGLAVVLQNIVGSMFNSHLSQVTQGMLYCLAVGLIGSLALSRKRQASISTDC